MNLSTLWLKAEGMLKSSLPCKQYIAAAARYGVSKSTK